MSDSVEVLRDFAAGVCRDPDCQDCQEGHRPTIANAIDAVLSALEEARERNARLQETLDGLLTEDPCPKCGKGVTMGCYGCKAQAAEQEVEKLKRAVIFSRQERTGMLGTMKRLRKALERQRDNPPDEAACGCDHSDEKCCARVGERCVPCEAAAALSPEPAK